MTTSLFVISWLLHYLNTMWIRRTWRGWSAKDKICTATGQFHIVWTFFISLFIIWLLYEKWVSNLSVYMSNLGMPLRNYSFLWTINAGLLVLIQSILSLLGNRIKNLYNQFFFGMLFVGLSFLSLVIAHDYPHFIFAWFYWRLVKQLVTSRSESGSPVSAKGRYQD